MHSKNLKRIYVFVLALVIFEAVAHVPPHEDFPADNQGNSGLGVGRTYTPNDIHPRLCRYASDKKCKEMDMSFRQQKQVGRKLVESGRLRVLVLLVQWKDHEFKSLIDPSRIDALWNSDLRSTDAPSGSITSYLRLNSYGQFHVEADIIPWTMAEQSEAFYANNTSGLSPENDIKLALTPILSHLDSVGFDWTRYDEDSDGLIDSLVVMHSGFAAELGRIECHTRKDSSSRIWSHSQGPSQNSWGSNREDVGLGSFLITSAFGGICGEKIAPIGVILHEFLHSLGLPYLHDLNAPKRDGQGLGGVGFYDIMSNPYGPNDNAIYPGLLSPWSKMTMGWLRPIEILRNGIYTIGASIAVDQVYKISHGYSRGEYLLIENRQAVIFDSDLLMPGGILIWHIDENKKGNEDAGFPGQEVTNGSELPWPQNGRHYKVALVQADGLYELEKALNDGDGGDFWTAGMELKPGASEKPSFPNTDGYAYGKIAKTGVSVKIISPSATRMQFEVTGIQDNPNSPDSTVVAFAIEDNAAEAMTIQTPWGSVFYEKKEEEENRLRLSSASEGHSILFPLVGSLLVWHLAT